MRSYGWRPQATRAATSAAPRAALRGSAIRYAPPAARPALSRAALLGSVWLGALSVFAPNAAQATDGTWIGNGAPVSNEWTQGNNWNSTPTPNTVPDITATFTNNGAPTSVTISNSTSINTIDFTAGAPTYSFTVQNGATFTITGGTSNSSSFAPAFTVNAGSALQWGLCRDRVARRRRHGHNRVLLPPKHRRQQQQHVLWRVRGGGLARAQRHGFADADRRQQ